MSTLSEIVAQAFREGNFTAVGETVTTEEMLESVPRLRALITSLFGFELGEQYQNWHVPVSFVPETPLRSPLTPTGAGAVTAESYVYPPPNSRLIVKATSALTLYFPAYPDDGARMAYIDMGSVVGAVTLNGNGHKIENALTLVDGAAALALGGRRWFYRADLADWIRIDEQLEEDSDVPLPMEFDDLFVTGLVVRLAPRFQLAVADTTTARFTDMLDRAKKRYKQSARMPTSPELHRMMSDL